ncbi:HDOD domain-containing protein [Malaciobacter halophilus]|uniref:HDOD domain-containing protein n=1 Tax=Malaciobacter halophilus TaxID=197482 RepID=A0A2N1J376_9BACT|nr:HDOD domain-containing protein [Malaciobacter halophilus]AXH08570.1 HDOD domain-containing protein [Malaciobacter halophilus]PKI81005.1 HDOD domain-containing protein [Malaciobacter halophilus]
MSKKISDKIDSLPPLPKSVIELEKFRKLPNKDPDELLKIIEKDPLIVTTLLRVANSSMFAFRSRVDTVHRAISLLGVNFCISIALGSVVQDLIRSNLEAYAISTDEFMENSNLASSFVHNWMHSIEPNLKDDLILAAFLQEVGKFIISDVVIENNQINEFQEMLKEDVSKAEKEFTGFTCAKITANIFKHWKLDPNLIFSIGFVQNLNSCPKEFIKKCQILEITKYVCEMTAPLSERNIQKAINKAIEYDFDIEPLVNTIDNLKAKTSNKA